MSVNEKLQIQINSTLTLIAPTSKVTGGKVSAREVLADEFEGASRETKAEITVTIADVEERKRAERLVFRGAQVLRKNAVCTVFGWVCPREKIEDINRQLSGIAFDAENFNAESVTCKVRIGILSLDISQALVDPSTVRAITDHVVGELNDLRVALRSGKASQADSILKYRVANLHTLSVGIVSDAIKFAIDESREQLRQLKAKIKGDGSISETPESAGRSLDLNMLDSAIGMLGASPLDPTPENTETPKARLVA